MESQWGQLGTFIKEEEKKKKIKEDEKKPTLGPCSTLRAAFQNLKGKQILGHADPEQRAVSGLPCCEPPLTHFNRLKLPIFVGTMSL